jgi:hypothetical protein
MSKSKALPCLSTRKLIALKALMEDGALNASLKIDNVGDYNMKVDL